MPNFRKSIEAEFAHMVGYEGTGGGKVRIGMRQAKDGRPIYFALPMGVAARVARQMLSYVKEHAPEFAECKHTHTDYLTGKCSECGEIVPGRSYRERTGRP